MIAVNAASAYTAFGGLDVGAVSDKYPTLFTPEGFTFLIWILIYFSLFLFMIYQITKGADKAVGMTGIHFFFSCILNSLWIIAWSFLQIGVSLIIMIVLLITVLVIYLKLNKDKYSASTLFVKAPFSIYLAWLCVATAANFAVFFKYIGWDMAGISEEVWLLIVLTAILLITSYFVIKKKDTTFSIVILWALFGLLIRHLGELESAYPYAVGFIVFMFVVIIIENVYNLYKAMTR
jgi:hypothetical protein